MKLHVFSYAVNVINTVSKSSLVQKHTGIKANEILARLMQKYGSELCINVINIILLSMGVGF